MPNADLPHALDWRKSSRSGQQGECVEVAALPASTIAVRDSKDPDGPVLNFERDAVRTLAGRIRAGQLDL